MGTLCLVNYGVQKVIDAFNGIQEPEYAEKIVYMPHEDPVDGEQLEVSSSTSQPAEKPRCPQKPTSQFTKGGVHGKRSAAQGVPKGWYKRTDVQAFEVGLPSKDHL